MTQQPPYVGAAASILAYGVCRNIHRKYILYQGASRLLSFLVDFAKEGWLELHSRVEPSELKFIKIIGSGAAATVWEGEWDGKLYAIKRFHSECISTDFKEFKSEVAMMSLLSHPHIVTCLGASLNPQQALMVAPLFSLGSLYSLIHESSISLSKRQKVSMALDAAMGMEYLHAFKVVHRDLKPENLLVSGDLRVAVSDFGISRVLSGNMTKAVGSPLYIAPEVFETEKYSMKVFFYFFLFNLLNFIRILFVLICFRLYFSLTKGGCVRIFLCSVVPLGTINSLCKHPTIYVSQYHHRRRTTASSQS